MNRSRLLALCLAASFVSSAQHQEVDEKPALWQAKESVSDTGSLLSAFRRGRTTGHFRYFFMATDNAPGLSNPYAHALGGGIKMETARFRRFQLGISGFFVFNVGSSDLAAPDPLTGQKNRYETGLFDIQDPANRTNIDRLEELYLRYHLHKGTLTLGRQLLNTPFLNLQDGRMRPTVVDGIWADLRIKKNGRLQAGFIHRISPRSTVSWFSIERSVGVYPTGVTETGSPSGYAGRLQSRGILLAGYSMRPTAGWTIQAWDQFAENLFNTLLIQADRRWPSGQERQWTAGLQVVRQDAVHDGGHPDPELTYFRKGGKTWVIGLRAGRRTERSELSLNYTRITAHGRYLMPREWGRDPFFTFLPRERNEGLGDLHAWVLKGTHKLTKTPIDLGAAAGVYRLPELTNYRLNKYGMPSYYQLNVDVRRSWKNWLEGLETQLLFIWKGALGKEPIAPRNQINKVNMSLWNLVFNYRF
jgi:hypothetical protein